MLSHTKIDNTSRTNNSIRNSTVVVLSKMINVIFSFIVRTLIINKLGIEILGIDGLFASVITVLSLADLGIGTAITYSLYKPIANQDYKTCAAYMNFFQKVYVLVGSVIFVLGLLLIPFLPYLINLPNHVDNLMLIYILTLASSAISYFLSSRRVIYEANQVGYAITAVDTISSLISQCLQVLVIVLFNDYVIVLLVRIFATILSNGYIFVESNKDFSYIFKKTNTTSLFGLTYSTTKLEDIIKPTYDNNYTKLLNPKKNEYISQFDSNSELVYNKEDYDNYFKIRYKEINESSNNYMKVYWKNDTSFHIPKILTTIYFFHPFSRPNLHDDDNQKIKANDRLYFEYILYFAYIFRSMTEQLADVFRAGNSFHIEFKENFFVFDLFFYSDIAEKAMDLFNNIICDKDKFMIELNKKFEIYKDIAFEDFDLGKNLDLNKRRFIFYQEITKGKDKILPPIYNHYNFPYEDFSNIQYNNLRKDEISSDIDSIKYIFLFGYCNETKASNIYQIFMNNNFDLKTSFDLAGYTNTKINASNFVNWTLDKSEIDESHNVTFYTKDNRAQVNRFIIFTNYSLKYYCLSNMLIQLLEDDNNYKKDIRNLRNYEQKYIFISFFFKNNPIDNALFMNNAIESLNNNEKMRKPVDLIGDRFYYFLNSHKKITAVNHNNMFDSAWWITYDTLYHRKIEDNEDLDFQMETYQKFIDEIKEYINNQTKYIDVINEKKKL